MFCGPNGDVLDLLSVTSVPPVATRFIEEPAGMARRVGWRCCEGAGAGCWLLSE